MRRIAFLITWEATGEQQATLILCGKTYNLHFESASAPWTFSALLDGTRLPAKGQLHDVRQHTDRVLPALPAAEQAPVADAQRHFLGGIDGGAPDAPPLVTDVAASGPWFWAGSGPLGFLRGGVLVTPWGEGVWGLERKLATAVLGSDVEHAPPDAVCADFAGSFHTVRMLNPGCLRMRSVRKTDGDVVGIDFAGNAERSSTSDLKP